MKQVLSVLVVIVYITRSKGNPLSECSGVTPPQTNEKSYEIFNVTLPWYEALIYCRERNMDLATVRSPEENEVFLKTLQAEGVKCVDAVWLGGTILHSERGYFWMSDSEPVIYSNWALAEPNDLNGKEKCLSSLCGKNWQWNDLPCENSFLFACEHKR